MVGKRSSLLTGNAYLVREASNTRITLVKKRCAWYLRVKFKRHNGLPNIESEEFLEVCGLWKKVEAQAAVVQQFLKMSREASL